MPIYEYVCTDCGHQFELLLLPSVEPTTECPECYSRTLERLVSGFAVSSADITHSRVSAARRQISRGKDRTEQKVAEAERIKAHTDDH